MAVTFFPMNTRAHYMSVKFPLEVQLTTEKRAQKGQ